MNNNFTFENASTPTMREEYFEQNQSNGQGQQYQEHPLYQEQYQVQQQRQPIEFPNNPQNQRKEGKIPTKEQDQSSLRFESTSTEEGTSIIIDRSQQQVQIYNQDTNRSERGFSFDQLFSENDPSQEQIQQINKNQRIVDSDRFMRECIPGANFFQPSQQKSFRPQEQRQFIASEFTPTISERAETNSFRFYSEFHNEEMQPVQKDRWSNQQQYQYRFRQPSSRYIQYETDQASNNNQTPVADQRKFQEFHLPCFKQLSSSSSGNDHKTFENVDQSANIDALQAALDSQMNGEIQETVIPSQSQEQQFQLLENNQGTPSNIDMEMKNQSQQWQHSSSQVGPNVPTSENYDKPKCTLQNEDDNNNNNNNNLRQTTVVEIKKDKQDQQNSEGEVEEGFVFPWFMEITNEQKRAIATCQTKIKTNKLEKTQGSKTEQTTTATDTATMVQPPQEKKKLVLQIELAVDKMINRKRSKKTLFYLASDGKQKKFSRITKSMIRPVCNAVAKHMRNLGATVGRIDWVNQLRKFLLANESCIPAAVDFFENHFENYVNNSQKLVEKSEYLMFKNNWIKGVSDPINFHGLKSCCQNKEEDEGIDQDGKYEEKSNQ